MKWVHCQEDAFDLCTFRSLSRRHSDEERSVVVGGRKKWSNMR